MLEASFIHRWFDEVWNGQRESAVDEMFAADGIVHGLTEPDGSAIRGPESFKKLHRQFVESFPDLRVIVEDTIVEGDKIAARCRVTGSHKGRGIGVEPTDAPVEFTGMTIVRVNDGKITEAWNEFNFMDMYRQIGALALNFEQK
jgi:predicted ester cyclase